MDEERKQASDLQASYKASVSDKFSWTDGLETLLRTAKNHVPVVLFGPPGTGKTAMVYHAKAILENEGLLGRFEAVQFHKKFTYEDFIEGFAPGVEGNFVKKDGVFKRFCREIGDEDINIFLIDEMNRAELTTTFGELLFLIEDRKTRKVKTSHFSDEFSVPDNLSLIGTMNTADRNIAILDYALRRRFTFIPVFPDYEILRKIIAERGYDVQEFSMNEYVKMSEIINQRISRNRLMGRNMQLGQTMWIPKLESAINLDELVRLFQFEILPQLESYCGFGYEDELKNLVNPNIANKYLNNEKLSREDIVGLVRDMENKQE